VGLVVGAGVGSVVGDLVGRQLHVASHCALDVHHPPVLYD